MNCTSTWYSLKWGYSAVWDSRAVWSQNEFLCSRCELSKTCDGKVLVVEIGITSYQVISLSSLAHVAFSVAMISYFLHNWQNPWFSIIVSVRSDSKINLFIGSISSVSCHQPKQRVFSSLWADITLKPRRRCGVSRRAHRVIFNLR